MEENTKEILGAMQKVFKRMKRKVIHWEIIFANPIASRGAVSRICRELSNLNSKKTNDIIRKWAKDMKCFMEEDMQ